MRWLLAFTMMLMLHTPVWAQIKEVHLVTVRNTTYEVTEVVQRAHEKIPRWYTLICKRGKEFVVLRCLDGSLLRAYVSEVPKQELQAVPDFRPAEERHPCRTFVRRQGPGIVLTALQYLIQ